MKYFVLDTNIVISAMLWGGRPLALLNHAQEHRIFLCTSRVLLDEFANAVGREKLAHRISPSRGGVAALVSDYRSLCRIVNPAPLPAPIAPDPDDDWVIATAIAAQADLIVAGDKPFLGCRGGGIDPHYYGWGRSGAILIGQPFLHAIVLICSDHVSSIHPAKHIGLSGSGQLDSAQIFQHRSRQKYTDSVSTS